MGSLDPKIAGFKADDYKIIEKPSRGGRKLRIVCLGAGASGLNLAHEIDTSPLDLDLVCYEKNPSIGGTWYENKYPGCGCDIPSVNYQFSWAPSPEWSSFYSGAPEILQYFKDVAEKYDLNKYVRLNHRIVSAIWNEDDQLWHFKVQRNDNPDDVFEDKANIFINASGVLKYAQPRLLHSRSPLPRYKDASNIPFY